MSTRRVRIVLLCEDSQQEAFTRRFLEGMGWNTRELRVEKSPSAKGSAAQWVKKQFPKQLGIYRARRSRAASGLIVMIDADLREVQERKREFEEECNSQGVQYREVEDAVAITIPRRNIETWIHYLNGEQVFETKLYQKLEKERLCRSAVSELVRMCQANGLPQDAPPSLPSACEEYGTRIRPLA